MRKEEVAFLCYKEVFWLNSAQNPLGTQPIGRLLVKLAIPTVIAQLINVLYNIVDRIYIGNIPETGAMALTGLGITFPILMIISAFAAFVGMGAAPLASMRMGEGRDEDAEKILGTSCVLLLLLAVVLTAVIFVFKRPLLYLFGASDNIFGYADDYLTIYLMGTVFVMLALGLNTFISAQGFAATAMLSVLIGAICNIILDPVFIFLFGMGVQGAALATILSQGISAAWIVLFLVSRRSRLRIRRENLRLPPALIRSILALGISPFVMQATESLVNIVLNRGLQDYGGDLYVGTLAIMTSLLQFITLPSQGVAQGAQPIISYNFGAGNIDRAKETFRKLLVSILIYTTVCCLLMVFLPSVFARVFTADASLLELTAKMMPIYFAGIWAFGLQLSCQITFLSLGQAKISLFLALLRKVFLLIPLSIILPHFFGVMGIYWAEPIADVVSAFTALGLFLATRNRIFVQKK